MTYKIEITKEQAKQIGECITTDIFVLYEEIHEWCRENECQCWIEVRLHDDIRIFVQYFLLSEDEEGLMFFKLRWL